MDNLVVANNEVNANGVYANGVVANTVHVNQVKNANSVWANNANNAVNNDTYRANENNGGFEERLMAPSFRLPANNAHFNLKLDEANSVPGTFATNGFGVNGTYRTNPNSNGQIEADGIHANGSFANGSHGLPRGFVKIDPSKPHGEEIDAANQVNTNTPSNPNIVNPSNANVRGNVGQVRNANGQVVNANNAPLTNVGGLAYPANHSWVAPAEANNVANNVAPNVAPNEVVANTVPYVPVVS